MGVREMCAIVPGETKNPIQISKEGMIVHDDNIKSPHNRQMANPSTIRHFQFSWNNDRESDSRSDCDSVSEYAIQVPPAKRPRQKKAE
jgi:hypothetical protein